MAAVTGKELKPLAISYGGRSSSEDAEDREAEEKDGEEKAEFEFEFGFEFESVESALVCFTPSLA